MRERRGIRKVSIVDSDNEPSTSTIPPAADLELDATASVSGLHEMEEPNAEAHIIADEDKARRLGARAAVRRILARFVLSDLYSRIVREHGSHFGSRIWTSCSITMASGNPPRPSSAQDVKAFLATK